MSDPKIYSHEEIAMFVNGGRREIDELLLTGYNSMAQAFIAFRDNEFRPHAIQEGKVLSELGTPEEIRIRREWLDRQLKKDMERDEIRRKILTSAMVWAIPILLAGFLGIMQVGVREKIAEWLSPTKVEQKSEQRK